MLESNPLYAQSLSATRCSITTIDLANAPVSAIEKHMNEFVNCLMVAWYAPVTSAGFELPHPSVTVYTSPITSPCGDLPTYNAVYCTADQQIYYAKDLIEAFPPNLQTMRFLAESVIAHEFGHEIQYRTMILVSAFLLGEDSDDAGALDLSRRVEMQADCLAGVFLASVADSTTLTSTDERNIVALFTSIGTTGLYEDDHGSGANRGYWTAQGLASTTPGVCTTFTAPDDLVG
jgi:predicted metalloprotease